MPETPDDHVPEAPLLEKVEFLAKAVREVHDRLPDPPTTPTDYEFVAAWRTLAYALGHASLDVARTSLSIAAEAKDRDAYDELLAAAKRLAGGPF